MFTIYLIYSLRYFWEWYGPFDLFVIAADLTEAYFIALTKFSSPLRVLVY